MNSIDLNIKCGEITVNVSRNVNYKVLDIDLTDVGLDFITDEVIESIGFEDYIRVHGIDALAEHLKKHYTFNKDELTIND